MARKRVYWIGLKKVVVKACRYYMKWKPYLPTDLDPRILAALDGLEIACDLLIAYDRDKARGLGV